MCGRTALSLGKEQVRCACSYKPTGAETFLKPPWAPEHNDGKEYRPSTNIAPTDVTPVLVSGSSLSRILKPMMWGIIPQWHKDNYRNHKLSTNNIRIENIKSSKLYSPLLKKGGRCVIVVEGFYEWKATDKSAKVKQPYYIYAPQDEETKIDDPKTEDASFSERDGWKGVKLLHMAGLYSMWKNQNIVIYAYSVITMDSNDTLNWLHHRMPAILDNEEQINAWLDVDNVDPDVALSYLRPIRLLSWYPVSTAVNNSRNKSADCNKRQPEPKNKGSQRAITSWFTKNEKRKCTEETLEITKRSKT